LDRALFHERRDVVVRVGEAVEREGGVVLEVAVAGGEKGEEGLDRSCGKVLEVFKVFFFLK
jgi:hypothetical protein